MKIFLLLNLLFNLNRNIINDFISNRPIYKYKEMKEIRYIYFYNFDNFNIDEIEIYAADKKISFNYELIDYYTVDLNNYYPLSCITIVNNQLNSLFSIKYNNINDFNEDAFAYIEISNNKKLIKFEDLLISNPKWSIISSNKKLKESESLILIEWKMSNENKFYFCRIDIKNNIYMLN